MYIPQSEVLPQAWGDIRGDLGCREVGGPGECGPPAVETGGTGSSARPVVQDGWVSLLLIFLWVTVTLAQ